MAADTPGLIAAARAEPKAARAAQDRAASALAEALERVVREGFNSLPATNAPPSEHRREHRPGIQRKIDADPDLQTFIRARIDRLTFAQIAAEVAAHFPPRRRVGRSAIHAWWTREQKATPATLRAHRNAPDRAGPGRIGRGLPVTSGFKPRETGSQTV